MSVIEPPSPAILDQPGVVRFAAGSENGLRSMTWRVKGFSNSSGSDDIYVGTRQTMATVKVSLHDFNPRTGEPPRTILRYTREYREANDLPNKPLAVIERPPAVAPGWRHELTIATPRVTFGKFVETPPLKAVEAVQWWAPEPEPNELAFHLFVGDADDRAELTIRDHIGEAGRMSMDNGRCLWIIANSEVMPKAANNWIVKHLAGLTTDQNLSRPFTLLKRPHEAPTLLDLAVLHRISVR